MKPFHLCKYGGIRFAHVYESGAIEYYAVAAQLSDFASPEAAMRTATYLVSLEDQMRLQAVDILAIDVEVKEDVPAWCTTSPAMRFVFKDGKVARRMKIPKRNVMLYHTLL